MVYFIEKGGNMTATMNIPDKLYRQADETASTLGISNMQLFVLAIEQYVREHSANKESEKEYISDLASAQISSMDKIWNTKEEDEIWSIL
jgi:metal-responsive CopG/Arc/MetJ family transcriptional regulator